MTGVQRILGIDPGSRITGWGIIDSDGRRSTYIASGCIRARDDESHGRLRTIWAGVQAVITAHAPQVMAVERVFIHRNADSALKLGQARAAAICASFIADLPVHEYAARAVKLAVVGNGGADKAQVGHMVAVLLNRREAGQADESDALAIALCHAHSAPLGRRLAVALAGSRDGVVQ